TAGAGREFPRARHTDAVSDRRRRPLLRLGSDVIQRAALVVLTPSTPVRQRLEVAQDLVFGGWTVFGGICGHGLLPVAAVERRMEGGPAGGVPSSCTPPVTGPEQE